MNPDVVIERTVHEALSTARRIVPRLPTVKKALMGKVPSERAIDTHFENAQEVVKRLGPLYLKALMLSTVHHNSEKRAGKPELERAHQDVQQLPPHHKEIYNMMDGRGVTSVGKILNSGRGGVILTKAGQKAMEALLVSTVLDMVDDLKDGEAAPVDYVKRMGQEYNHAINTQLGVVHVADWGARLR